MGIEYRVALSGFSAFERAALASYFRLVATRATHHYIETADSTRAEFTVVDADQPELVVAVLSAARVADTVFVGAHAPPTAMARLQRPIDPRQVVLELDVLVAQRGAPALPPSAAPAEAAAASGSTPGQPAPPSPPSPPSGPAAKGDARLLLVGPANPARQRLAERLQGLGVPVLTAHRPDQALEELARRACSAVFIDATPQDGSLTAGDLDGLLLCQDIKRGRHRRDDAGEVPVVLVATRGDASDRVRGHLAGCDAYLVEPVGEAALLQVLRDLQVLPEVPTPAQQRQRQRKKPPSTGHRPAERG